MSTPSENADSSVDPADSIQPLRDNDTSIEPDPTLDPAQAEWDRTTALDEGADPEDLDPVTNTGADPAEIPDDDDEIPAFDLPGATVLPETQGDDPLAAELGEDGQGDLAPEDL
ncbi:sugar ABC transporter ATPase [Microbacterium pygmaeum]|nr:sugar ABC transporter ATPase [Microbacterium pygmaeum]